MSNWIGDLSQRKAARVAGLLYLLLIVFGVFAELVIRSKIIVFGNAATTASNILASPGLWRIGFASDVLMILCFLLLPLAFYVLFKPVGRRLASLVVILVSVSVPLMLVNMLLYYAPLHLLSGVEYLAVFSTDQLNAFAMASLDMYTTGVLLATLFHGLWLVPLGILAYRSGYFPKVLGILLMLACLGFVVETVQYFLLPSLNVITTPAYILEMLGEFGFCGWLLIKGAKVDPA
ncbi:DUF4386 domain-containing protein [Candidatus Bipolaricaulota bacterium]|nr:DUF4386 domain-containing protein [Candidatus Bipolaricaulota bacterium]